MSEAESKDKNTVQTQQFSVNSRFYLSNYVCMSELFFVNEHPIWPMNK